MSSSGRSQRRSRRRFVFRREVGLPFEHGVETLDRGDDHLAGRADGVRRQALDGVELGEFPVIVRRAEALKLLLRLLAEVAPIDEEQHPPRAGVADEPVDGRDGEDRLAGSCRHLNQGARMVALERPADVADRLDLDRIEEPLLQFRQRLDAAAQRRRPRLVGRRMDASALQAQAFDPGVERLGPEPLGQRFRLVDVRQVRDAAALLDGWRSEPPAGILRSIEASRACRDAA